MTSLRRPTPRGQAARPPRRRPTLTGERHLLTSAGPASGLILAPGSSGSASFEVANLTGRALTVQWNASFGAGTSPAVGSVQASGLAVGPDTGSLTVAVNGEPLDAANVRRSVGAVCRAAGIGPQWIRLELRHSFVSLTDSVSAG